MKYSVFLFDADNTLLDFDRSSREAFSETLAHLDIEEEFWHFQRYLRINRECWELLEKGEIGPEEVKALRFKRFLNHLRHDGNPKETGYFYLDALSRKAYLEDGAIELLDDLKNAGYTLGLITNGLSKVQRPRFRDSGLNEYFETVVISEEIGSAKPMPAYFEHTLNALNAPSKADILIVGDTPASDILGGQQMGMATCWYNPRGASFPFDPGPTHVVEHLGDIRKFAR
ncbi:MAG: noncanonical pyrimidine nucleotidase, YjjG family [Bacteroidetes bacterium]|nr:noncanonical pyrimidine nucleotidase, YjjG family [Bacteroidota bacterium]